MIHARMVQPWHCERLPEEMTEHSFNLAYQWFAAVHHKYNWLNKTLHMGHNVRSLPVFKDIPKDFLNLTKTAYPRDPRRQYTPELTGIPPHNVHLTKVEELKKMILDLENNIINRIVVEMETRQVQHKNNNRCYCWT